jgi:ribonuclease HI/probable phosphoglycerate mutase
MNGEYKILDEKIQKLFIEVWNLKLDFKSVKFKSVLREKNREADQLVNEALDNQSRADSTLL